ncbi:protein phosphatase 1 regulatory subunit 1A-like isoform X2 [Acipenser oxyrinchus oxyrinchus]|uniref:Protein phosphatase 1 regulatory subunit 1A n=1 Tax=Acipenser oxyrinchus oxyrinchus TaxID=40147 RepID=A0AAD8FTA0_ACIOX|nr:protein phosphatase 1 regulatory subunit 1A-like isoform X2 [Acipenser oxyrinchus oxyrinchus]
METGSPRKIQFTMPLLDSHLDPEAAEQIRRRRPTPATLVMSSDQSSPEIDEDRIPNQLYKAALMNSPRQRRKGARGTPTMKELQFLVEHHLYKQQQQQQQQQHGGGGADECSSESLDCLSDRPSPDCCHGSTNLPEDDGIWSSEAFEKLQSQLETPGGESEASVTTERQSGALKEEGGVAREATAAQQTAPATESSLHSA